MTTAPVRRADGLSARAIALGCLLGAVLAAAAVYTANKTGSADGASIPVVLVAFAVLSALGGRPTTHEGNIVQTICSTAVFMSLTSGIAGPITGLALVGREPPLVAIALWSITIGVAACVVAIPLRDAFVVRSSYPFPTPTATAEVIARVYTGTESVAPQLRVLGASALLAAAFTGVRTFGGWFPSTLHLPSIGALEAPLVGLGFELSPLLLGTGLFVRIRLAIALTIGAAVTWFGFAPWLVESGIVASSSYPEIVQWTLWPGIGLIFGGSLPGLLALLRRGSTPRLGEGAVLRIPIGLAATAAIAVVLAGWLAFDLHPLLGALALAMSVVVTAGATRSAAETDMAPCGPLGGLGQLVIGQFGRGGITTPLGAGAVINGIVMQSATLVQNWKVGAILRTPPRAQLIASLAGVVVGAIATTLAFELLRRTYGYGSEALPSPDAVSWLATAQLVERGLDAFPRHAGLAALVATIAGILLGLPRFSRIAPSPIALGIAFILPAYIAFTIAVGAAALWLLERVRPAWSQANATSLGAGAIAGEAIMGLVIAAVAILR